MLEFDPIGNALTPVGWMILINWDGTCRLTDEAVEIFLEYDCRDKLAANLFSGRARALALDAVSAASGSRRPRFFESCAVGVASSVVSSPFGTKAASLLE